MKKVLLFIPLIFTCLFITSCVSTDYSDDYDVDVPFEGVIDSRFGYEDFYWGMYIDDAKNLEGYPFVSDYYEGKKIYFYGEKVYDSYFHSSHGIVWKTDFYFSNDRLYKVVERLKKKNVSLEELHQRYGEFSDENIVKEFNNKTLTAVYTNRDFFDSNGVYSLLIKVKKDGTVEITMMDAYANYCMSNYALKQYLFEDKDAPKNKWLIFGCTDGKNKKYDIIAKNANDDDKSIIMIYSKSPDAAIQSSLRIGFQTDIESMGIYEIKTQSGIKEMYLDSSSWSFRVIDWGASITTNEKLSVREFYNLLLDSEELAIRKYSDIYKFKITGFEDALNEWGITLEELDFAIANEDF